jgi:hypothetical protein
VRALDQDADLDWPAASVTGQARVPDGDRNRAYIACPDCGRALRFTA